MHLLFHENFIFPADGNNARVGIENGYSLDGPQLDLDAGNVPSRRDVELDEASDEGVGLRGGRLGVDIWPAGGRIEEDDRL